MAEDKKTTNRKKKVQASVLSEGMLGNRVMIGSFKKGGMLGGWKRKTKASIGTLANDTGEKIGARVENRINAAVDASVDKHGPEIKRQVKDAASEIKKQARNVVLGLGGATVVGSYLGTRAGNRKKKIKESNLMLFSFAIGLNSAFSRGRSDAPNCLIQEGIISGLASLFKKKSKPISSVLSTGRLGAAMGHNTQVAAQARRLYPVGGKTISAAEKAAGQTSDIATRARYRLRSQTDG